MTSAGAVEPLAWDSDFFGIAIGRARSLDLDAVITCARRGALRCVYLESPTPLPDAHGSAELVLADRRVRLRQLGANPGGARSVAIRRGDERDLPRLASLLDALVPWSRFARDKRFGPDQARRMYTAWLARAARGEDEALAIATSGEAMDGFVTVSTATPPEIGLIASRVPGTGSALLEWTSQNAAGDLEVVTQSDNERALALYRRNGFDEVARSFMYHVWIPARG